MFAGGNRMKISLTAKEDMPKNSAIPPQTPVIDRSFADFLSFWFKQTPPLRKNGTSSYFTSAN
jgi:hypothetical protein